MCFGVSRETMKEVSTYAIDEHIDDLVNVIGPRGLEHCRHNIYIYIVYIDMLVHPNYMFVLFTQIVRGNAKRMHTYMHMYIQKAKKFRVDSRDTHTMHSRRKMQRLGV